MEWSEIVSELLKAYHLDSVYERIKNISFGVPSKPTILLTCVSKLLFLDTSYPHTNRSEDLTVPGVKSYIQHILPSSLQIPRSFSR